MNTLSSPASGQIILAIVCLIVGLVFMVIQKSYTNANTWFLLTLIVLSGLPQALLHLF